MLRIDDYSEIWHTIRYIKQEVERMEIVMTRLEILTLLYALEALLDEGKPEKANEVIKKVINEAERVKPQD